LASGQDDPLTRGRPFPRDLNKEKGRPVKPAALELEALETPEVRTSS
jgi:hypothetical protein